MIKILSAKQIQKADTYTIEHEPIPSIELMERAAHELKIWVCCNISKDNNIAIFAGTGNNGGDAFALARMLFNEGYKVSVYSLNIGKKSNACIINYNKLNNYPHIKLQVINENTPLPDLTEYNTIIDGIFGNGLNRPIAGYWGNLIEHINKYAKTNNSFENNHIGENESLAQTQIISIDIPSGLFCEDNKNNTGATITATHTLSFQFPKLSFLFAENSQYVGKFHILNINLHPQIIKDLSTKYRVIEKRDITPLIRKRNTFDHKGTYGHAFLIAGGYQKTGAAVLAARACLKTGVGLLTVHVPQSAYNIMQTAVPEAMLCIDETEMEYCSAKNINNYTNIGIGPGIGTKKSIQNALFQLITNYSKPLVIDADAINIIAENKEWLKLLPHNSILTPHPGEFDRLTYKHKSGYHRLQTQQELSIKYNIIIVLKGAFTSISEPCGNIFFNPTGNPGMATAGSGDVLTGIILSLLAQGYSPINASITGTYLHGLAGDIAKNETGEESLIASDIINNIANAYKYVKQ